jgi:hypothetical protein
MDLLSIHVYGSVHFRLESAFGAAFLRKLHYLTHGSLYHHGSTLTNDKTLQPLPFKRQSNLLVTSTINNAAAITFSVRRRV